MSNEIHMVRYGKSNRNKTIKNTLYTIKKDGIIYFGISRCNRKDTFRKESGKYIASNRAILAENELEEQKENLNGVIFSHPSNLRGAVNVQNVVELLRYFDDIDRIFKKSIKGKM